MTELITLGRHSKGQDVTLPVAALFSVACPTCGAGPGLRCRGQLGPLRPGSSHKSRARAAIRAGD